MKKISQISFHVRPATRLLFQAVALVLFLAPVFCACAASAPEPTVQRDVVYGYKDGMALILDVVRPAAGQANRCGLIYNVSGGFGSSREAADENEGLMKAIAQTTGYTVFLVMHGCQPRYTVDEIVPEMVRAVRFVRYSSAKYGVDPNRLGVFGFSSGGHLALMMGLAGDEGKKDSPDPVERTPCRLASVVAFYPPTDFMNYGRAGNVDLGTGVLKPFRLAFFHHAEHQAGEEALGPKISPITYVRKDAPAILLFHGDKDPLVPIQQSRMFVAAMKKAGATCELRVRAGGEHGWGGKPFEEDLHATLAWFDKTLKPVKPAPAH